MTPRFAVVEPGEEDWPRYRDLRLEMLADTPIAYLETLEHARGHDEAFWRGRVRPVGDGSRVLFAAEERGGRWIGSAGGVRFSGGTAPMLVGVYVSPDRRGRRRGVLDALLDGVERWARGHGDLLLLEVHEANPRAIAAYEHRGFVRTGRTAPYPLPPNGVELEMVKRLHGGAP